MVEGLSFKTIYGWSDCQWHTYKLSSYSYSYVFLTRFAIHIFRLYAGARSHVLSYWIYVRVRLGHCDTTPTCNVNICNSLRFSILTILTVVRARSGTSGITTNLYWLAATKSCFIQVVMSFISFTMFHSKPTRYNDEVSLPLPGSHLWCLLLWPGFSVGGENQL